MTSRLCALVVVLIACNSSASPPGTPASAAPAPAAPSTAAPPTTPPPTTAPTPAEPGAADLDKILAFLQDRSAQSKIKPETVNQSMAGLGPAVKELGKGETGWDFRGEAPAGLVRKLNVSFVPASKPNGEYIDPPVWQFKTASFTLDLNGEKPSAAFTQISNKLNAKLKKPKWKKPTSAGWKLVGHWEIWLSMAPDNTGVEILVAEPEGP